ncbi:MAG: response regulator transcription factor [Proteobacteria bacterium]|nr:response regulator transcription factor [Pseudomonadota bacterium]
MTSSKRILIVEDDEPFRRTLGEQLRLHEDFVTIEADTGGKALELAKAADFDIIILDVGLPDMDGREVCRLMRHNGVMSPIIMLTGADTDADTILGLDGGANDYVTKPFRFGVLLARLRAQIRQHERSEYAVFTFGCFTFHPRNKFLLNEETNEKIRLTDKEAAILKYLVRARGRFVDRDVLLDVIWGYSAAIETHTLETHIYRLRQKIERDPSNAEILVSERGGYRLVP